MTRARQSKKPKQPDSVAGDAARRGTRSTVPEGKRAVSAVGKEGVSAFLFDAGGDDREVTLDKAAVEGLADDDLLWIDVDSTREGVVDQVADAVSLPLASVVKAADGTPFIQDFGDAFALGVLPLQPGDAPVDSKVLVCAVGRNWLVTVHEGDVGSLSEFADHVRGDSNLGRLDSLSFLARLLQSVVNAYFDRLDDLQQTIDDLEEGILRERVHDTVIERLVEARHDIGRLRRRLSPHRQVFSALSHPSFDVISGSSSARDFAILNDHLETAIQTVDITRDMIVGAFDVFMSQTAQRTNRVMRVLTTVSVVLLPATVIAGIFGMNMLPRYLLHSWMYWVALALMLAVSGGLLLAMRVRYWR